MNIFLLFLINRRRTNIYLPTQISSILQVSSDPRRLPHEDQTMRRVLILKGLKISFGSRIALFIRCNPIGVTKTACAEIAVKIKNKQSFLFNCEDRTRCRVTLLTVHKRLDSYRNTHNKIGDSTLHRTM